MYAWEFIQEIKHVRRAVSIHKWKTFVHSLDCADLKTLLSLAKYMYIQYVHILRLCGLYFSEYQFARVCRENELLMHHLFYTINLAFSPL